MMRGMDESERTAWRERARVWLPFVLLAAVGLGVAWWLAEPAPPGTVVIATGSPQGAYHLAAGRYEQVFADNGVTLERRTTAGSMENAQLLQDRVVDAALVQGGVLNAPQRTGLEAVAAVFYEPLWLVRRASPGGSATRPALNASVASTQPGGALAGLAGLRIAVGPKGSGTRATAVSLLADHDLTNAVTLLDTSGRPALQALRDGAIDAAFFVIAPTAPLIDALMRDASLEIVGLERAPGLARRYDTLEAVTLHRASFDPAEDLPHRDLRLLAPVATLVVHDEVHPAVVQLLVQAAQEAHHTGTLLNDPGVFPNVRMVDLPLHDDVRYHIENGPGFLQRQLPFWLASFIDRLVIFIIPLLVLLIPLAKAAPSVYRWRIRARIYRWYRTIRELDETLAVSHAAAMDRKSLRAARHQLDQLDVEVLNVKVPLSYMEEFYNLRLHMGYVRGKIDQQLSERPASEESSADA